MPAEFNRRPCLSANVYDCLIEPMVKSATDKVQFQSSDRRKECTKRDYPIWLDENMSATEPFVYGTGRQWSEADGHVS